MKKQFSDHQIDNLMRSLVRDAGAEDETVNDIAGSPALWWGVQRQIATQKEAVRSPWPPIPLMRRWLIVGLPVTAAILLGVAAIMMPPAEKADGTQVVRLPGNPIDNVPALPVPTEPGAVATKGMGMRRPQTARNAPAKAWVVRKTARKSVPTNRKKPGEVRSEFIALSYAGSPESGQMVRVKVPRSMMVTLGLVATVERPNGLVDADVVVGDDGMTHAIRFIR